MVIGFFKTRVWTVWNTGIHLKIATAILFALSFLCVLIFFFFFANKLVKIFENGWSKICGRLHLKNLNWYGLHKRTISLKFFKGFFPKILHGPFLNTLIQMFLWHLPGAILKNRLSIFVKKGALKALLLENTKSKSFKESGLIFINKKAKKSLVTKINGPRQCTLGNPTVSCNCHRLVLPTLDCQSRGSRLITTIQCLP